MKRGNNARSFSQLLLIGLAISIVMLLMGCKGNKSRHRIVADPVDSTITKENAITDLHLDSTAVYRFIREEKLSVPDSLYLLNFYRQRNFHFAWFNSQGLVEQARNFVNLYRSYRTAMSDSTLYVPILDDSLDFWLNDSVRTPVADRGHKVQPMELWLTRLFFRYAGRAYEGNESINPADFDWFIPRKKLNPIELLDSVLANKDRSIQALEPVHPLFDGLLKGLEFYSKLATDTAWPTLVPDAPKYKLGDSAKVIALVKERLVELGDLVAADTGDVFTTLTAAGVAAFQSRHGLTVDSVAGKQFFEAINISPEKRIRQILVNVERARWVPKPNTGPNISINIPAFRLYVYDSGKLQFDMAVVVGKPASNTVIFNGDLKYVVMAPYWNVPYSIVKYEMGNRPAYIARNNMEVVGHYSDGLPMVRQRPGKSNSLGQVKFLFPNEYSIYLHDSPAKSLFNQSQRAFSHGCIRIAQPAKLANWVLRFNPEWPAGKIEAAMQGSKEVTVTLKKTVPVSISYFTCWLDAGGKVQFRNDIYGHDKKMEEQLFANSNN